MVLAPGAPGPGGGEAPRAGRPVAGRETQRARLNQQRARLNQQRARLNQQRARLNQHRGARSRGAQEEVTSGRNTMNDSVLAKLLKLQYVRCVTGRQGEEAYPALLVALLGRRDNSRNLTLQVARELASLACSAETTPLLRRHDYISQLVLHLQHHAGNEMVLFYLSMTLDHVAKDSAPCRRQLSASGLARVVVPQLLRSNLRVRTVFLRLLEHCYGSSRGI